MPDTDPWYLDLILIYTGHGKGKTSACVGQAMRALGHAMVVVFLQFFKRKDVAGEQKILAQLLGDNFRASGPGFFRDETEREAHRSQALASLRWAAAQPCQMLVLDEVLYALKANLLLQEDLEPLVQNFVASERILVLSGRGLPLWLHRYGDIITTMEPTRHAHAAGFTATKGVEY